MKIHPLIFRFLFTAVGPLTKGLYFLLLMSGPGVYNLKAESPILLPVTDSESGTLKWSVSVFSGEPCEIPFKLIIPEGQSCKISYDLFQITSGLAAPLQKAVEVGSFLAEEKKSIHSLSLTVPMPKVERSSLFLCRVAAQIEDKDTVLLGQLFVTVYPPKEEVQDVTRTLIEQIITDHDGEVVVFGRNNPYLKLLEDAEVEVEDLSDEIPASWRNHDLMIGSGTQEQLKRLLEGRHGRLPDKGFLIWVESVKLPRLVGNTPRLPNGLIFRHLLLPAATVGDATPDLHHHLSEVLQTTSSF
jgi:hypothetical protein